MTPRPLLGGLLLTGILTLAPSVQAYTCDEYADAVAGWARTRADGLPAAAYIRALQQDVALRRMHPDDAAFFEEIITAVWAEPTVTPEAWHRRAYQACRDFAAVQPPRIPQLQAPKRK